MPVSYALAGIERYVDLSRVTGAAGRVLRWLLDAGTDEVVHVEELGMTTTEYYETVPDLDRRTATRFVDSEPLPTSELAFPVPVAVVLASGSQGTPIEDEAERLAAANDTECAVIDGAGHGLMLTHPSETATELRHLLQRVSTP